MTPDLEEAVKRLEGVTWPSDRSGDLEMVIAELRRLSAPVAGTYVDACKMACPNGCGDNWAAFGADGLATTPGKNAWHFGANNRKVACTAPTELEWGEQNARRVAALEEKVAHLGMLLQLEGKL